MSAFWSDFKKFISKGNTLSPLEMTAVVDQSHGIGLQIAPGPVESRQFAERRILRADLNADIIAREACNGRLPRRTDLERKIDVIGWHPIGLMRSDYDLDIHGK